jgi:hypothetical protein
MDEGEFYAAIGRLTREQGWNLDSVCTLALGHIARTKAQREGFIRTLRRLQVEENAHDHDECLAETEAESAVS